MDQAINHIDWDSILKVHESFRLGVGMSNIVIPGLRKKEFDSGITIKDLKSELRCIVRYMIDNDIPHFHYSNWIISWSSDLWDNGDLDIEFGIDDIDGDPDDEMIGYDFEIEFRPKLEIIYCLQRIKLFGECNTDWEEEPVIPEMSDEEKLEVMLKKALESENYEQASKIRDLIKIRNKKSGRDK